MVRSTSVFVEANDTINQRRRMGLPVGVKCEYKSKSKRTARSISAGER